MTEKINLDLVGGSFNDMAANIDAALKLLVILQELNELPESPHAHTTHALAMALHLVISRVGMVNEMTGNAVIPGMFGPLDVDHWLDIGC